jgi:hypothetical protein
MKIKNLDKNLLKRLGIILAVIIVLFIILCIIISFSNKKLSYTDIESKLITAAKSYYQENPDELPQNEYGYVTINSDKLVEEGYIKSLDKLVKDDATCTGQVKVSKNDDYLLYSAMLSCGDYYETKKLRSVLTSEDNIVTSGNGLYLYNNSYIFRGDNVSNYVSFAGRTWLIIGINSDGTIRLIDTTKEDKVAWDDRYNSDKKYNVGINDYSVSRMKDYLLDGYNSFTDSEKAYLTSENLCIGKRDISSTVNDGSIECSEVISNQPVGLLQANEFALASLDNACTKPNDPECTNYNYLTKLSSFWSITADSKTSYKVFKISGSAFLSDTSSSAQARMVININSDVNYVSGDGSQENPYVFK